MKKGLIVFLVAFSHSLVMALPWVDDAFLLVETETPKEIQRAIDTDYSFKKFTRTRENENLLMAALKNARGNDVIDVLLKQAKISPDSKTKSGVTALMYACQYETDIDAIENVLLTGANSDSKRENRILAKDKDGQNCFDYARKNEAISQDVLNLLRSYADEPLPPPVEEPLSVEIEEEPPIEEIESPPSEAEPEEEPEVAETIPVPEPAPEKNTLLNLSEVATPNVIPESIYLYDYAENKYAANAIPKNLIAAEEAERKFIADANKRDANGKTKLMLAAKNGDITLIENLLYSGANINARDEDGWTALMYAARFQENADVTQLLLYKGADRTIKNKYGITSLMLSAGYSKNPAVISLLLESYSANSDEAREALAYGISNYNTAEALQSFIDKGVPLNIPFNGKTPLMLACETSKNTKIIEWLLKNGASKYQVEAATGRTAYDYARENKKLPHNVVYWSLNPNS